MKHLTALLALAASAAASAAGPTLIDFERAWSYGVDVAGYYGGGSASDGGTGANLGVSFVNVSGLSNDSAFTYYAGAPSMLGVAYAYTVGSGDRAFMNVGTGATGTLSVYYSSPSAITGAIRAYAGSNGTGALLGSFDFNANDNGTYSSWSAAAFGFSGIARSFDFTGSANLAAFDNVQITAVPEPATYALILAGGALVGALARRRQPGTGVS